MTTDNVDNRGPSPKEKEVLTHLAKAWNAYLELPSKSIRLQIMDDDLQDFRKAIHDAQRIVMSRAMNTSL